MSEEIVPGDNCKFIFKKRPMKNRGNRKRNVSDSEEGILLNFELLNSR